jgi:hypothetical protein
MHPTSLGRKLTARIALDLGLNLERSAAPWNYKLHSLITLLFAGILYDAIL